jgi:hypothetical protein
MAFFKKPPHAPVEGRELDVRLALALGWSWHEAQPGLALLCPPPEDACEGFFYDEHGDGYQFVPRWSTDWRAAGQLLVEWATRCSVSLRHIAPRDKEWFCDVGPVMIGDEYFDIRGARERHAALAVAWAICQLVEALPPGKLGEAFMLPPTPAWMQGVLERAGDSTPPPPAWPDTRGHIP